MTIGTPEGLVSAVSEHQGQRRGIAPRSAKLSKADETRAYDAVTKRDDETCQRCRKVGTVQRDHRQNRMVGNTVPSNLQLLCPECHMWKTEHADEALREGWAVLRHTTLSPAEWPARRWIKTQFNTYRLGWVLYFDEPEHGRMWFEVADIEAHFRLKAAGVL